MDCRTARLLLDCARPRSAELDAAEAQALEEHLSSCPDCDQLARAERRTDEAVAKAMRRVDVPDQLRNRILARLGDESAERRRWVAYGWRAAVAAAAVLLLGLGLWWWYAPRPVFPAQQILTLVQDRAIALPTSQDVKTAFASQGVAATPPPDLNYSYLRWTFLTNVEGRQTPLLIFNKKTGENGSPPQHALVFLIADNRFNLDALSAPQVNGSAYEYTCATSVQESDGKRFGYVIYYTGDNFEWLQPRSTQPESANGD